MIFQSLPDDNIDIINKYINIHCHTCNLKYNLKKSFYKKEYIFYYCSKQCYYFIS